MLTLLGVALFVALGSWQWRRGQEKAALFAAFDRGIAQAPVPLQQARGDADGVSYPHVTVRGYYAEPAYEYELENQVRDGRVGVMVYALFEPADGGAPLLVNRGFLAYAGGESRYPALPPLPRDKVTLSALYAPPPGAGLRLGGNGLAAQKFPKKMIYLDLAEISTDLDRTLDPRVLLTLPDTADGTAFVRQWRPEVFPPERHYGYALTWFTFAAVVVATFATLHWRKMPQ
ncbi:SURF1 family protein [Dokdonella sp.]|uniref:SURF1 family protein n=1 Tax=Dokdonella sp. TaxID=2291710 RepID=UPI001B210D57|nr:SURF1 family protein [Dokdonella sp.]MBO9661901.1 SURF1 family protein [Dokdonella sp.]